VTTRHPPARLRADHQDAVLTSTDIAFIRATLAACAQVLAWAADHGDRQTREKIADATQAAHGNRSPAGLACYASLAIDHLDFAPPARRSPAPAGTGRKAGGSVKVTYTPEVTSSSKSARSPTMSAKRVNRPMQSSKIISRLGSADY